MTSETQIAYEMPFAEAGMGEPVVLVHGTLNDQRNWAPQMAPLGARFRTMAVSLRHFWPERWDGNGGRFTIAQHVEDVADFLRRLGEPVRLVGHSRGGHIALRVASRHPGLVRALVLAEPGGELDPSLGGTVTKPGEGEQAATFAHVADMIRGGDVEEGLRVFAERNGGPGAWELRSEERRQIARDNARTLLGQVGEQRQPISKADVQAVSAPTLLVGGANTRPNFIQILDALEREMTRARRITIPDAGHAMNADNPDAFNAAVLAFLSDPSI